MILINNVDGMRLNSAIESIRVDLNARSDARSLRTSSSVTRRSRCAALCWQDVLEEWLTCQRSWLYLEPIFSSDDINRQLPVEGKRYQTMERTWRKVMTRAHDNKQVRPRPP